MNLPISCVILEDEPDILEELRSCVGAFSELRVVGVSDNVDDAFLLFQDQKPQAAFMDIKLIGGSAFSLLDRLRLAGAPLPRIVLVSGFPAKAVHALNHYHRQVVHFIEKPFLDGWENKFRRAVDALLTAVAQDHPEPEMISISSAGAIERLHPDEIAWIKVIPGGKICVVAEDRVVDVNLTLAQFLDKYPRLPLQRISRTEAVNLRRVLRVLVPTHEVVIRVKDKEETFCVGDSYFRQLLQKLE